MTVQTSRLFYTQVGNGTKTLLLFHGFGQDHRVFTSLAHALSDRYTCYLFDLYYHGQSIREENEHPLEKTAWKNIVQQFLTENSIESFSVLGYSMGSKFALATLEAFPASTKELFLLAPDGIKASFWYNLAISPFIFRRLFKSMIAHHDRFLTIGQWLSKTGLVDKRLLRFVEHQMNTTEKRKRVYYGWVVFRKLKFNMKKIAALINQHNISTTVIVGEHDLVIRPESVKKLLKHVAAHKLHVLPTGHNLLADEELLTCLR